MIHPVLSEYNQPVKIADHSDWGHVWISGADRFEWLQGIITNDIRLLTPDRSLCFCFCSPTGQILTTARALAVGERIFLSLPPGIVVSLVDRLNELILMEDVTLNVASGLNHIATFGAGESDRHISPRTDAQRSKDGRGSFTFEYDTRLAVHTISTSELPKANISGDTLEVMRVEAGIPILGKEITDKTLPPELGAEFVQDHISYTKGCYTGQEVLARIRSRGHTNRTLVSYRLSAEAEEGTPLRHATHPQAGFLTSVVWSPKMDAPLAIGFARHEFSSVGTVLEFGTGLAEVVAG